MKAFNEYGDSWPDNDPLPMAIHAVGEVGNNDHLRTLFELADMEDAAWFAAFEEDFKREAWARMRWNKRKK